MINTSNLVNTGNLHLINTGNLHFYASRLGQHGSLGVCLVPIQKKSTIHIRSRKDEDVFYYWQGYNYNL